MVIAVAGWFFGAEAARGELFDHIHGLLGDQAAAGVQTIVENAHHSGSAGGVAAIIVLMLAIGASATFSSLNSALNVVWPAQYFTRQAMLALVRVRLISFGLVYRVSADRLARARCGDCVCRQVAVGRLALCGGDRQSAATRCWLAVLAFAFAGLLGFLPGERALAQCAGRRRRGRRLCCFGGQKAVRCTSRMPAWRVRSARPDRSRCC